VNMNLFAGLIEVVGILVCFFVAFFVLAFSFVYHLARGLLPGWLGGVSRPPKPRRPHR
jgi:hypothetical protein